MKTLEQIQESALKVDFNMAQQQHFDKLMSELEVISGGLGFADLKAKAELGSKEALQIMRDYITKKEKIVEFIETKRMPYIDAETMRNILNEGTAEKAKEKLQVLLYTSAFDKQKQMLTQKLGGVGNAVTHRNCVLLELAGQLTGDIQTSITQPWESKMYNRENRLYNCADLSLGVEEYDAEGQFLSILMVLIQPKNDLADTAGQRLSDLKKLKFYMEEFDSWFTSVTPDTTQNKTLNFTDLSLYSKDQLLYQLVNFFLGQEEEARQGFGNLKQEYYDPKLGWKQSNYHHHDEEVERTSTDQLMGIMAEAILGSPYEAKEKWQELKKDPRWVEPESGCWRATENSVKGYNTSDELMDIILTAIFEKLKIKN